MKNVMDEPEIDIPAGEIFVVETQEAIIKNVEGTDEQEYEDMVKALDGFGSYTFAPKKLDLDLKNYATPPS